MPVAIVNLHRANARNCGDVASSPLRYFDFGVPAQAVEIKDAAERGGAIDGHVIVGGGGLLDNWFFDVELDRIVASRGGKAVFWGVGVNRHWFAGPRSFSTSRLANLRDGFGQVRRRHGLKRWLRGQSMGYGRLAGALAAADLVGLRDETPGRRWVPCASCMHPAFDRYRDSEPARELVVYEQATWGRIALDGAARAGTRIDTVDEAAGFLASGEVVVTTSYHAAYWATLLGRRAVVVPWSTKFLGMRHRPAFFRGFGGLRAAVRRANAYPEALDECRAANRAFADDVAECFGLSVTERVAAPDADAHAVGNAPAAGGDESTRAGVAIAAGPMPKVEATQWRGRACES